MKKSVNDIFKELLNDMVLNYRKNHTHPEIVRFFISGMIYSFFIRQAPKHLKPQYVENV